ncbi:MAG: antitoxin MazE family protein [Pseudomonadota bacterium]
MPSAPKPKPSRVKVREHRERLRRQGLRPIQIWVPDVRAPAFRSEAHRQSLAVAASSRAHEDQAFIDAVSTSIDEADGHE